MLEGSVSSERREVIEMGIDDDGTIADQVIETYYCPREEIGDVPEGRYLRVIGDNGGTNVEIRIPYEDFEGNGWVKSASVHDLRCMLRRVLETCRLNEDYSLQDDIERLLAKS